VEAEAVEDRLVRLGDDQHRSVPLERLRTPLPACSEPGSYVRLIDLCIDLRVIKKKKTPRLSISSVTPRVRVSSLNVPGSTVPGPRSKSASRATDTWSTVPPATTESVSLTPETTQRVRRPR